MSLTPEEIRALAIECGFYPPLGWTLNTLACSYDGLAAYTAALLVKERERCAVVCETPINMHGTNIVATRFAEEIRSLK